MDTDREVLQSILNWLINDQVSLVYLITVVETWGSAPRPVSSIMAIRPDGVYAGSISGGCVEMELAKLVFDAKHYPVLMDLAVDNAEAQRIGLACGGKIKLLVEQIDNDAQLQIIANNIDERKLIARQTCLTTGESSLHPVTQNQDFSFDSKLVKKVYGPLWQLLIVGAGQLTDYLSRLALNLGYKVVISEHRELVLKSWQNDTVELFTGMPDDAVNHYIKDNRSAVVCLSHTPNIDDLCLLEALESPAFYIGALGSRKNNNIRLKRLAKLGLSQSAIRRLNAPIGLPIGSRTPPEIALSIMAQITEVKNNLNTQKVL